MLTSEMIATVSKLRPELTDKQITDFVTRFGATVTTVYIMDRFDSVFTGPDRHAKCFRWIFDNERVFLRYHRARNWPKFKKAREIRQKIAALQLKLELLI